MIRNGLSTRLAGVTFFLGCGKEGAQWTLPLARFHLPVQTVLLPLVASDFLGIFQKTVRGPVSARFPYFSPFNRFAPSMSGCHPYTSETMNLSI